MSILSVQLSLITMLSILKVNSFVKQNKLALHIYHCFLVIQAYVKPALLHKKLVIDVVDCPSELWSSLFGQKAIKKTNTHRNCVRFSERKLEIQSIRLVG